MENIECTNCLKKKPTTDFYFDKTKNDYRSHCKECVKLKRKEYRERNKEAVYSYNRIYSKGYKAAFRKPKN